MRSFYRSLAFVVWSLDLCKCRRSYCGFLRAPLSQEPEVLLAASGNPAVLGGLRSRVLPAEVGEILAAARQASGSRAELSTYPAWLAVHRLSPPGPPSQSAYARPDRAACGATGASLRQSIAWLPGSGLRHFLPHHRPCALGGAAVGVTLLRPVRLRVLPWAGLRWQARAALF